MYPSAVELLEQLLSDNEALLVAEADAKQRREPQVLRLPRGQVGVIAASD